MEDLITDELRCDLLTTALEGGSNYWYELDLLGIYLKHKNSRDSISESVFNAVLEGTNFPVFDCENGEQLGNLNLINMCIAEHTLSKEYEDTWERILEDTWDADDADIWFQHVVMGKLVYG